MKKSLRGRSSLPGQKQYYSLTSRCLTIMFHLKLSTIRIHLIRDNPTYQHLSLVSSLKRDVLQSCPTSLYFADNDHFGKPSSFQASTTMCHYYWTFPWCLGEDSCQWGRVSHEAFHSLCSHFQLTWLSTWYSKCSDTMRSSSWWDWGTFPRTSAHYIYCREPNGDAQLYHLPLFYRHEHSIQQWQCKIGDNRPIKTNQSTRYLNL